MLLGKFSFLVNGQIFKKQYNTLVTLDMPFKDCCAKCHEAKCRNGLESLQRTNKKLNILKGKKGFKDFLNILLFDSID